VTAHPDSVDGLSIVEFLPEYAAAFRELNIEWLQRYFRVEPVDLRVLQNPEQEILASGGSILFARLGSALVGTLALKHHGNGIFELTKMAVTPRAQGLGIGRQLLSAGVMRFHALLGAQLYLESHSSLAPALHLYESSGFRHAPPPRPSEYRRADVYMVYAERSHPEEPPVELLSG
jgi:ribosomal protein S18 acetylase RimI-like enzyme